MLNVLWIEDDKNNIDEYTDGDFEKMFGKPIVPTSFEECYEYTKNNLAYDVVIIDIDLSNFSDFNNAFSKEIEAEVLFENNNKTFAKVAGFVIYAKLLEYGFPKKRIIFLTANAGSQSNTYDEFEQHFTRALMPLPEYFIKEPSSSEKLSKHLKSKINEKENNYLTLRRGIIEGCNFLKLHIKEDDSNIQFRDFIKLENNKPSIEIPTTEIENYLDALIQSLVIRAPIDESALNIQYRLFLRSLVHEWEENIDPNSLKEKHANDLSKIRDIYTFAWLMKMSRNWVSHANLLEPLDSQIIAFLFLVNMRTMFKLTKVIQTYEHILLRCITSSPANDFKQLNEYIDRVESDIDGILSGFNINESCHFGEKINTIYRRNTGNPDAEAHDFKRFLLQYFWVNQKVNLRSLTANSDEFLPTLARHIYSFSFKKNH